jgi:hypothetical protein
MRPFQEDVHAKNVEYWFSLASKGMTPKDQVLLLEKGIATVERRACQTLSSITLKVVIDRVLHETQQKFPVISDITLDEKFLNFSAMDKEKYALEKVDALTYLLVELMKVLARLTANILNTPLNNELKKVTKDSGES